MAYPTQWFEGIDELVVREGAIDDDRWCSDCARHVSGTGKQRGWAISRIFHIDAQGGLSNVEEHSAEPRLLPEGDEVPLERLELEGKVIDAGTLTLRTGRLVVMDPVLHGRVDPGPDNGAVLARMLPAGSYPVESFEDDDEAVIGARCRFASAPVVRAIQAAVPNMTRSGSVALLDHALNQEELSTAYAEMDEAVPSLELSGGVATLLPYFGDHTRYELVWGLDAAEEPVVLVLRRLED